MKYLIGDIIWKSTKVSLRERIYLFCYKEKCMSGKVISISKNEKPFSFKLKIEFIDPDFFKEKMLLGDTFNIVESTKVLAEGIVKGVE